MTQIEAEQRRVTAMYEQLAAETAAVRARLADPPAAEHAALLTRRLSALQAAEAALCFGRIDRVDGTSLHIGRCGLWADGEPLLVDWRAEAARPFYAATPAHPMGLRRRRHLRLAGRSVRGLADEILDGSAPGPDDVIGDGPLAEALDARRTGRMRAAVTTLRAEQDAIVRSPDRGVTVVQGGPGTGKTIVALHRVAYLLFAFPAAAARGVLVVGPDARFLEYISQVLPSLGENDVRLVTRTGITGALPAAAEEPAVARLKGRAELAEGLRRAVRARQPVAAPVTLPVGAERIELPGRVVAEAIARGLPYHRGRAAFKERLVAELVRARTRATRARLARIDAETAELVGFDLDEAVAADLRSLGFDGRVATVPFEDGRRADRPLTDGPIADCEAADRSVGHGDGPAADGSAEDDDGPAADGSAQDDDGSAAAGSAQDDDDRAALLRDEDLDRAIGELWPVLTPAAVVTDLLADPGAYLRGMTAGELALLRRSPGAPWTDADLALVDEAAELLDGPPDQVYGHVAVDEAQELTEMDWRAVMRRCPARSMTLVGDFAQAGPGSTVRGWAAALGPHVGTRFTVRTLTVNYRTTAEILDSTRDLLATIAPGQRPARSLRHGPAPRVRRVPTSALAAGLRDELRAQAAAHPGELIAVIGADATAARLATTPVADLAHVVPVSAARGREFDSVVVVFPDEIVDARPSGRRDLYVALTRATRRLCVLHPSTGAGW